MSSHESKICATCGRRMEWRRAWAAVWDSVRYCSSRCRSEKPGRVDRELEDAIVEIALRRGRTRTLCPSEAARAVRPESWRPLMERARRAARRLAARGTISVLQNNRIVDPSTAKGPIRLRITEQGSQASRQSSEAC